jgi:hypothetical protein
MAPLAAAAAVVLIVAAATVTSQMLFAGSRSTAGTGNLPRGMGYVLTGDHTVVPVDLATGTAGKPISFAEPGGPVGLVIPPRGQIGYVATVRGLVIPINLRTGKAERPIRIGGVTQGFLMARGGRIGYALQPPFGVAVVNLASRTRMRFIRIRGAYHFAMTPNGKTVYVLGQSSSHITLTSIATATSRVVRTITVGARELSGAVMAPGSDLMVGPDSRTVYVVRSVTAIGAGTEIVPIETATSAALAPIVLRTPARYLFIAANGKTAYEIGVKDLIPIDLATGRSLSPIPVPGPKVVIAVGAIAVASPPTSTMFMLPLFGSDPSVVLRVDTATNTALTPIRIGAGRWAADALIVGPSGKTLYVFSAFRYAQPRSVPDETLMTQVRVATGAVIKTTTLPGDGFFLVFQSGAS